MRRTAVAAAIIAAVLLGLSACGDDDPKLEEQTLRFTEQETDDFSFADNPPRTKLGERGPERLSPGDELSFRGNFVDASKKDVGDLDVACTITKGGRFDVSSAQCNGTASLPGGSLILSAGGRAFSDEETTRGAVIGGTGKYSGATGNFTSTDTEAGSKYVFHVFVPKK